MSITFNFVSNHSFNIFFNQSFHFLITSFSNFPNQINYPFPIPLTKSIILFQFPLQNQLSFSNSPNKINYPFQFP